jgi:hypothetical protein
MTVPLGAPDMVPPRPRLRRDPLAWFALQPADRPLVEPQQRVIAGDPLLERVRDPSISEARLPPTAETPQPGEQVRSGQPVAGRGRRAIRFPAGGRVLYEAPSRQLRVAVGTQHEVFSSPVAGVVETVTPGGIGIRAEGLGLPGVASAGDAAAGRLVIAVPSPDAELRASAIDVGGAGAILVAGSRVDVEALTRARAMGVRGIITGGLMGRDLRGFLASDARQRAALHPTAAFGAVVLDGYGKRPIPTGLWDCLVAAEGEEVGLIVEPPMIVLPASILAPEVPVDRVRVTAGPYVNREARFVQNVGAWRQPGGVYQSSALVYLEDAGPGADIGRLVVPLGDLERFE